MAGTPPHFTFRPVIRDQHTAARAYFLSILAMLFLESMLRLPEYLVSLRKTNTTHCTKNRHSTPHVWLHKLLTLPSPIPILTNHNLPSIFRCLVFIALNILFGWNRIRFTTDYQIYGWLTIANAGLALLLPTRTNLFSLLARIPSPVLLMYHRWAGVAAVVHATLHFSLTAQHYTRTNQFDVVLQNARIRVGIMAWAALAVMFLTSLRIFRRKTFELFYYTHFLFLVFVAGGLYHASHGPEFFLPGLILWALDRAVRLWYTFRAVNVTSTAHYTGGVTKLKFEGMKTTSPGQIAWVQIPSVSKVNWHPFTIASAPGESTGTVAIRGLGGYTRTVQRVACDDPVGNGCPNSYALPPCTPLKMRLDGPYGVGRLQWMRYPVVVIVAGGIGITPGISIAAHIVKEATRLGAACSGWHVHLLWTISDMKHTAWFEEELRNLAAVASQPEVPVSFEVSIYVTGSRAGLEEHEMGSTAKYQGPGEVYQGRPNLMQWFQRVRVLRAGLDAAVSLCGPRSLVGDARRAAADVSGKEGLFYVEEEVFEL